MRDLRSNTRKLWYSNQGEKTDVLDEYGYPTGDPVVSYTKPVMFRANLSATRGTQGFTGTGESNDYFGSDIDYSLIISTSRMNLPINEDTLIWDREPATNGEVNVDYDKATFRVTAVARGLHHMKYAVKRLSDVTEVATNGTTQNQSQSPVSEVNTGGTEAVGDVQEGAG